MTAVNGTAPSSQVAQFRAQRPQWSTDGSGEESAVIAVPLDYTDPGGERISIALRRRRATDPARRRGVLLSVHGGPGGDNGHGRKMTTELAHRTPLNEIYDLIGFDPRGTGASTRCNGEQTPSLAVFDSRPPDSAFAAITADIQAREEGCRRAGGGLRAHISTRNTARDMDVIRSVLDEENINFLGYAYGTLVGAVYGTMFPAHLDRSVLDSSVHPGWNWRQQFMSQAVAVRENVTHWAEWVGGRHGRYCLGTDGAQVVASVEKVATLLAEQSEHAALRSSFDGLLGSMAAKRPVWDALAVLVGDLRTAAADGDVAKAGEMLAGQGNWRPATADGDTREAVLEAVTCETDWPTDLEVYYDDMRRLRTECPYGFGMLRAQPWVGTFRSFTPAEQATDVRREGYPPGLVVQADGDPVDYHEGARAMARRLGHRLVLVEDSGEHEIYAFSGNPAVDGHVNRYLMAGELPAADVVCAGPGRPEIPAG